MGLPPAINFYGFAQTDARQITNHGDCGSQTGGFQARNGVMGIFVKIGYMLQMTLDGERREIVFFMEIHVLCGQIGIRMVIIHRTYNKNEGKLSLFGI